MTAQQKLTINSCRKAGLSFVEIAAHMNMPISTVKSYCYRHPIACEPEKPEEGCCPQCGAEIPKSKFRPRRFCSDECRQKYWTTHPELLDRKALVVAACRSCGRPFSDYAYRGRKYCCHACYIAERYNHALHE